MALKDRLDSKYVELLRNGKPNENIQEDFLPEEDTYGLPVPFFPETSETETPFDMETAIPSATDSLPPLTPSHLNPPKEKLSPFAKSQLGQWWNKEDETPDTRTRNEKARDFVASQREAYGPNPNYDKTPLATREKQKSAQQVANSNLDQNFIDSIIGPELTKLTRPIATQVPLRPEELSTLGEQTIKPETTQTVKTSSTTGKRSVVDNALQNKAPEIEALSKTEDSTNNALEEARRKDAEQGLLFGLLKAAQMGGAAIAGSKADTSFADDQLAKPDEFVRRMKEDIETKEQEDKRNPNSKISKLMQQSILALKPGANVEGLSAAQVEKIFPSLAQAINMQESIAARKEMAALNREALRESRTQKVDDKLEKNTEKRKQIVEEVEGFRSTIKDNIARAQAILDRSGTFELFGPDAELLGAITDEIATDMAKLQDPKSVARPAEVQMVRKNLIPGGKLAQLGMSNSSAKEILKQFEKRVDERASTAYGVRGLEVPSKSYSESKTTTIPSSKQTVPLTSPLPSGRTFTNKATGKRYKVNENGTSATEI